MNRHIGESIWKDNSESFDSNYPWSRENINFIFIILYLKCNIHTKLNKNYIVQPHKVTPVKAILGPGNRTC